MTSHQDILRTARLLIKQHGPRAEEYATKKLWLLKQSKDENGAIIWRKIINGIKELRKTFPGEDLH